MLRGEEWGILTNEDCNRRPVCHLQRGPSGNLEEEPIIAPLLVNPRIESNFLVLPIAIIVIEDLEIRVDKVDVLLELWTAECVPTELHEGKMRVLLLVPLDEVVG